MTDKEIRNKMYALVSDLLVAQDETFKMTNKIRKPIKDIMEEYRRFFEDMGEKTTTRVMDIHTNESEWKPYPQQ